MNKQQVARTVLETKAKLKVGLIYINGEWLGEDRRFDEADRIINKLDE